MKQVIWIKNEILDWHPDGNSKSSTNHREQIRAYELWNHAESLLSSNVNELHRVDAVSTLKRCLNQRLKFIESTYNFKLLSSKNSPKGYLEYLETFDLVRPLMLKKLMEIRNDIEHNDVSPPNMDRCLELLDLTWYFLKSTDNIVTWRVESFELNKITQDGEETQYGLTLDIDFERDHQLKIWGWFPHHYISHHEIDNSMKVLVDRIDTKKELSKERMSADYDYIHKNKLDNDIYVTGTLEVKNETKRNIISHTLTL